MFGGEKNGKCVAKVTTGGCAMNLSTSGVVLRFLITSPAEYHQYRIYLYRYVCMPGNLANVMTTVIDRFRSPPTMDSILYWYAAQQIDFFRFISLDIKCISILTTTSDTVSPVSSS
jgi:hypothetical protein